MDFLSISAWALGKSKRGNTIPVKRLVVPALVLAALVAGLVAAAPFIVSTDLVKQRIVDEIGGWTGRAVFFNGDPKVSLYPYLTVKLRDVEIGNPSGVGGEPFVKMDALVGKLKLLPLLLGRIEIAEFRLIAPHIALNVDAAGRPNWLMRHGLVAAGITAAKASLPTPNAPVPSAAASEITLGRFLVRDGTVSYRNALTGVRAEFDAVDMNLAWPTAAEAAAGSGSFAWGGETVAFNGSVGAPLALLAGGASPVRFALASPSLKASFEGKALHLDSLQLDGEAKIATPSLRRLLTQLGRPTAAGATFGAAAVAGRLNLALPTVSLDDAAIDLDGNHAEGALSASLEGAHPRIQGTIALETLDLSPYVEAFTGGCPAIAGDAGRDCRLPSSATSIFASPPAASSSAVCRSAMRQPRLRSRTESSPSRSAKRASTTARSRRASRRKCAAPELAASAEAEIDGVPARAALIDLAGIDALDGLRHRQPRPVDGRAELERAGAWPRRHRQIVGGRRLVRRCQPRPLRRPARQSGGLLDERRDCLPQPDRCADDWRRRRQHRRAPRGGRRLSSSISPAGRRSSMPR